MYDMLRERYVDLQNGPLSPRIFTGAVLLNFLSALRGSNYGVINNCSYKVTHNQRWWCRKFYENLNIYMIIVDLRVREEI